MDNRYRRQGWQQDDRDYDDRWSSRRDRQNEQFSSDNRGQYGDAGWQSENSDRWSSGREIGQSYNQNRDYESSGQRGFSDSSSLDDYDRAGASRYSRGGNSHRSFRGDDFGGQDYTRGSQGGGYGSVRSGGGYSSGSYGSSGRFGVSSYDRDNGRIAPRQYDYDERGFFDRASDEVMSWFGDDDAARRRRLDHREDHRGRGPSNYTRSSERLQEDACERLTRDPMIDASNISVSCSDNEITLDGTVDSRSAKRRAEDVVDDISGVKHVQNNLRVENRDSYYGSSSTTTES